MAESLYRKYRPQIFEDVVGQEHIERTIKNAIQQDKVSHAYLFTGPRGTGKTTTARLLAKALLCESGPTPEPDGTCEDCLMIAAGEHPDVYELDAASRTGVENVREEIIGRVQFAPTRGRYKIYIIDEVHMLSTAAFNALLKTLEEPPSHVVFVLATTDPQKVPETIHSRCQRFDFRRISTEAIVSRLGAVCVSEGVEFEGDALELVAHRADGGMRNALTSLEQLIAFGDGAVTMEAAERMLGSLDVSDLSEIVKHVGQRDVAACFRWTADFVETGADLAQFTRDFAEHVRNLYVMSLTSADVALDVSDTVRREMQAELSLFGPDRLARLLGVLGDLSAELKTSTNQRLSFEIALTRMVRPDSDLTLEALAERVEALERGHAATAVVVSAAGGPTAAQPGSAAAHQGDAAAGAGQGGFAQRAASSQGAAQARRDEQAKGFAAERRKAPSEDAERSGFDAGARSQAAFPSKAAADAARRDVAPVAATTSFADESCAAPAAAGPAGSGASGGLAAVLGDAAALQRIWQAAVATLKKAKAAYGVLFLNTRAVFDAAAGAIVVEFPVENDFAFKAVQKPDVQKELSAALSQAAGEAVPFMIAKAGERAVATAGASRVVGQERQQHASSGASASAAAQQSAPRAAVSQVDGGQARTRAAERKRAAEGMPPEPDTVTSATEWPEPAFPWQKQGGRASSAAPVDDYYEVPVDMYDGMAAPDDYDAPPIDVPFAAPAAQPSRADRRDDRGSRAAARAYPQAAPAASAQPSSSDAPDAEEPSISDLNANLAAGFGSGISFAEVNG